MLEGLELIELKGAVETAVRFGSPEHPPVEESAMLSEQFQSSSDRSAGAVEDSGGLAVCDLGGKVPQQVEVEARPPESVIEPEGLDGEGSKASAAAEPLDGAAVALAMEVAVESEAEALT